MGHEAGGRRCAASGVAPVRAHPGQGRASPERAQRASLARCARVRDSPDGRTDADRAAGRSAIFARAGLAEIRI